MPRNVARTMSPPNPGVTTYGAGPLTARLLEDLEAATAHVEAGDLHGLAVPDLPDAVRPDHRAVRLGVQLDGSDLVGVGSVDALEAGVVLQRLLPVRPLVEVAAALGDALRELPDRQTRLVEVRLVERRRRLAVALLEVLLEELGERVRGVLRLPVVDREEIALEVLAGDRL